MLSTVCQSKNFTKGASGKYNNNISVENIFCSFCCRKVATVFVVFKSLLNLTITTDKIIVIWACVLQCIFAPAILMVFLSQLVRQPVQMHPIGIYLCVNILLQHFLVATTYYISTTAISTEVCVLEISVCNKHE